MLAAQVALLHWTMGQKAPRAPLSAWLCRLSSPLGRHHLSFPSGEAGGCSFLPKSKARADYPVLTNCLETIGKDQNFPFKVKIPVLMSDTPKHVIHHVPELCSSSDVLIGCITNVCSQVARGEEERVHSPVRAGIPHAGDLLLQVQQVGGEDREGR